MEYPRLVYRSQGSSFEEARVSSEDERARRIDEGWSDTVPEAVERAGKPSPAQERAVQEELNRKAQAERAVLPPVVEQPPKIEPKPEPKHETKHEPKHKKK